MVLSSFSRNIQGTETPPNLMVMISHGSSRNLFAVGDTELWKHDKVKLDNTTFSFSDFIKYC